MEATLSYRGPRTHDAELLARLPGALRSLVEHRNGCIWLDGALHIRGACDTPKWHSLREAWLGEDGIVATTPGLVASDIPFAQTTFGDQLVLRDHDVLRVRADVGAGAPKLEPLGTSLGGFLAEIERDAVRLLDLDPKRREPRAEWEDLLEFWFLECGTQPESIPSAVGRWFAANDEFDATLRRRFLPLLERGEHRDFEDWCRTPRGTLAAVIVLDQLSRNLRRGTPQAFALDAKALALAKRAIAQGVDQRLRAIEAVFLYLPFEHSEDLGDQDACVDFYTRLARRSPENARASFEAFIGFGDRHRALIERFGRFPHRNEILQRTTTDEEREFLDSGGDRF